jgi:hypothetical protein
MVSVWAAFLSAGTDATIGNRVDARMLRKRPAGLVLLLRGPWMTR